MMEIKKLQEQRDEQEKKMLLLATQTAVHLVRIAVEHATTFEEFAENLQKAADTLEPIINS